MITLFVLIIVFARFFCEGLYYGFLYVALLEEIGYMYFGVKRENQAWLWRAIWIPAIKGRCRSWHLLGWLEDCLNLQQVLVFFSKEIHSLRMLLTLT